MDRQQQNFHKRLEGLAKTECVPQINLNYLSDKFANELRRAREASAKNTQNRCTTTTTPCAQVLKSNLPYEDLKVPPRKSSPVTSPRSKSKKRPDVRVYREKDCGGRSSALSKTSNGAGDSDADSASRPHRRSLEMENRPPYDGKVKSLAERTNTLGELEEKVEFLNTQAQQLLKQLKREQTERERMSELYDEALDEVRRLRERDRPPGPDMEARFRRMECERDEAFAKVRTAQVDNDELKIKLERIGEENQRDRQRWADKINQMEHRLHATDSDRDELARRHNRSLEMLGKMETQQEEQKLRICVLEDQKQEHLKQIENLGGFVKDLEQSAKQLHEKLDEKRHEVHLVTERMTEVEDIILRVDQHMQQDKDRLIQAQNESYQAQVRNQEIRTELRRAMKKKSSRNCD